MRKRRTRRRRKRSTLSFTFLEYSFFMINIQRCTHRLRKKVRRAEKGRCSFLAFLR
jgi:hypothetical protein